MIATPFEWLTSRFVGEDFVNEESGFGNFRDETTQLLECIHVLVSLDAYIWVAINLQHAACWSMISCLSARGRTMVIRSDLVTIVNSLSASDTALDYTAKQQNFTFPSDQS